MPPARQQRPTTTGGCHRSASRGATGSPPPALPVSVVAASVSEWIPWFRVPGFAFRVESECEPETRNPKPETALAGARRRSPRAFTLLELLTVIGVVALLTTITIGAISGVKQRANIARARSDLAALVTALEDYKRHYGEYPYLGPPDFNQATLTPANPTAVPGLQTVQAKLFNALTGVFGPRAFNNANRVSGPNFLDVGRFTRQPPTFSVTFQVPVIPGPGQPPVKQEQNIGLLDPWGRYYVYYYKSSRNPNAWQGASYILYSVGPDGAHTPPANTGLLTPAQRNAANNADNIYANL